MTLRSAANGLVLRLALLTALALAPLIAHAQWAVSPYVSATLQRSRDGMKQAAASPATGTLDQTDWATAATAAYQALVDTQQRIVRQQRALSEQTACLRTDLMLLEQEFERVRRLMNQAIQLNNAPAFSKLKELLAFLNERYAAVLRGAQDPAQTDTLWMTPRSFDPPLSNFGNVAVCPFSSDYLPPSPAGYGCDLQALDQLTRRLGTCEDNPGKACMSDAECGNSLTSVCIGSPDLKETTRREMVSLVSALSAAQAYQQQAAALMEAAQQIENGSTSSSSSASSAAPVEHQTVFGCVQLPVDGMIRHELRGPFSLVRSEGTLLNLFREQARNIAQLRPLPTYFSAVTSWLMQLLGYKGGQNLTDFEANQAEKESAGFAAGVDSILTTQPAFDSLGQAVGTFSTLAGGRTGVRSFVRDFAYFLRLSCVFRPCQSRLDRILKIVVTDDCFPYANGSFLRDKDNNIDRALLCQIGAGL